MKKCIVCLLVVCGMISFVARGEEFNGSKLIKYKNSQDYKSLVDYVEQCKPDTQTISGLCHLALGQVIVDYYVNKTVNADNVYTVSIDNVSKTIGKSSDKNVRIIKGFLLQHVGWWCNLPTNTPAHKQAISSFLADSLNVKYMAAADSGTVGILGSLYNRINDAKSATDYYLKDRIYAVSSLNSAVNGKLEKETIVKCINNLIDNVDVINSPEKLQAVLKAISKLSNPVYDEHVKVLLTTLNRTCYPKITVNDQWKAAVVKLNLVMKTYNLN